MLRSVLIWALIAPAFMIGGMWILPHQYPADEMIARSMALLVFFAPIGAAFGLLIGIFKRWRKRAEIAATRARVMSAMSDLKPGALCPPQLRKTGR